MDPVVVDRARHLHDAVVGQVVDQPAVRHVAVDDARLAGLHRMDDERRVLVARVDVGRLAGLEARSLRIPRGDLFLAPARVLVERDVEPLDQVGTVALDEPGDVLGEVLARLGDEVAQVFQHLVADPVPLGRPSLGGHAVERRVEVLAVALEAEVERHVVDPGGDVVDVA